MDDDQPGVSLLAGTSSSSSYNSKQQLKDAEKLSSQLKR